MFQLKKGPTYTLSLSMYIYIWHTHTVRLQLSLSNVCGKTSDHIRSNWTTNFGWLPLEAPRLTIMAFDVAAEEQPGRGGQQDRVFYKGAIPNRIENRTSPSLNQVFGTPKSNGWSSSCPFWTNHRPFPILDKLKFGIRIPGMSQAVVADCIRARTEGPTWWPWSRAHETARLATCLIDKAELLRLHLGHPGHWIHNGPHRRQPLRAVCCVATTAWFAEDDLHTGHHALLGP